MPEIVNLLDRNNLRKGSIRPAAELDHSIMPKDDWVFVFYVNCAMLSCSICVSVKMFVIDVLLVIFLGRGVGVFVMGENWFLFYCNF
jgi:hypothetical protein